MASMERRHNAAIGYSKTSHSPHPQLVIQHSHRIAIFAHGACASRVIAYPVS